MRAGVAGPPVPCHTSSVTTFGRRDWLRAAAGAILLGSPARAEDQPAWRFAVIADPGGAAFSIFTARLTA